MTSGIFSLFVIKKVETNPKSNNYLLGEVNNFVYHLSVDAMITHTAVSVFTLIDTEWCPVVEGDKWVHAGVKIEVLN